MTSNDYGDSYLNGLIYKVYTNGYLDEEIEQGFLEYKLRLDKATDATIKNLASQMLWRVNEGKIFYNSYKAYYVLGIKDNGKFGNICLDTIDKSVDNLKKICQIAELTIDYIFTHKYNSDNYIKIIIIKKTIDRHLPELKMFLLGNSMTEKTTFLGNLCYDTIDDLNGKSKLLILKHKHEIYSGKTSSIHHEIIGLTDKIINYKNNSLDFYNSWDKIFNQSDTIVNIFDSPGDPKFIKTTISNLLNINPEIIIIFTNKFDMQNNLALLIDKIKFAIFLESQIHIVFTVDKDNYCYDDLAKELETNIKDNNINCELNSNYLSFLCNNDINSFQSFKDKLKTTIMHTNLIKKYISQELNFDIYEIFDIPVLNKNIILSGKLNSGTIQINMECYINDNTKIKILNIHNKNIDCDTLLAGETGCLEIEFINERININRYMTIHNNYDNIKSTANISVIIRKDYNQNNNYNIGDEMYIYSKYFCNLFVIQSIDKIDDNVINIILKQIDDQKVIINKTNINSKLIIKFNNNYLFGELNYA